VGGDQQRAANKTRAAALDKLRAVAVAYVAVDEWHRDASGGALDAVNGRQ
jgi:hypothetical protein